jgi:hypothetical protein
MKSMIHELKKNNKKNVSKTLKTTLAIIALTFLSISCNKDDDTPTPILEQNPLAGFLAASGFDQNTTSLVDVGDYEQGFTFKPLVNGKMTAIVVKIPDVRNGLRVTVWNQNDGTVLRTETIDIPNAGVEVTKQIADLNLIKDKIYAITFNSNDIYRHQRTDGASVTFPFTTQDFMILASISAAGTSQVIPNNLITNSYFGDCSFKFQK